MTTQIQATFTSEVTVNTLTGEAFITVTGLAKKLNVPRKTVSDCVNRHQDYKPNQPLTGDLVLFAATYFALHASTPTQEAKDLLTAISRAGAKAWLYTEAGYVVSAAPIKQVALPEDYVSALRALADKEEQRILLMAENQEKHIETDSSTDYFTVRKIRSMNPDMKIDGKILGKVANIFNQPAKQVFDLYEQPVNTYTRTVWEEAYPDAELP